MGLLGILRVTLYIYYTDSETISYCTDLLFQGRSTVFLERISPEIIFLRPPEKLVIQVKAKGRYSSIQWQKNAIRLAATQPQFPNYNEILVYDTTTQDDLGLYEVSLRPASVLSQQNIPQDLDFSVVTPGMYYTHALIVTLIKTVFTVDANTTINGGSTVSVREGNSVTISCISTGTPTPSVFWELDGQPVTFRSTNNITEGQSILIRSNPNNQSSPLVPKMILSTITSNLLIVNAQYPDHNGVYTCIGSNDDSMINSSSAMFNVQVVGMLNPIIIL